jgi:colanic acid/amylovoran biosynthesis glycosyltransferase
MATCETAAGRSRSLKTRRHLMETRGEWTELKLAYLMNSYPITSTTFIRREIEALEQLGMPVTRYAVRHWDGQLVDPADQAEVSKTHFLLSGNVRQLLLSFFWILLSRPLTLLRGLSLWLTVCRNAGTLDVRHAAYLLQAIYFLRRTRADAIDHVHVHFSTNATTVAMLAHHMGGPGYSFTAHGPDEFVDPTAASLNLKVQHARFVVAISNYCKVLLVRFSSFAHWDKIVIGHCGLHMHEFEPNLHFDADNQNLVCVGRLCTQKAQLLFPQAVALVKDEFPGLRVHLIGDGESRQALEAEIQRLGVAQHFVLHGWMANSEVRRHVAGARAFLLPSFAEGLPVAIMEAFALGRPVISTYIAGIPELVDDTCGWIIPAGSVEHIAGALRAALSATPETLARLGQEGRRRVEREHNLKTIAPQLRQAFADFAKFR